MKNLENALKNIRVSRTLLVLKGTDQLLYMNKTEIPPDIVGINQWDYTIKNLMEELSGLLKAYDLTIEDIPEHLYKYDPSEDDEYV